MKKNLREVMISLTLSIAFLSAIMVSTTPSADDQATAKPKVIIDSTMVATLTDWGNQ